MKILVTGASGFVGSHVVNHLSNDYTDHQIIPIVHGHRLTEGRNSCNLMYMDDTLDMMRTFQPSVVIHLAGVVGGIGANRAKPAQFIYENLQMGINVIESSAVEGVKRVVVVGTVCSYPLIPPRIPFVEDDLWEGYPEPTNAPYGIAKRTLMEMALQYNNQYGMKNICLLPVNMYGPGDDCDLKTSHVIPALIAKMDMAKRKQEPWVELWGTGNASREFMYVGDFADACAKAAVVDLNINQPINIGTGNEITINSLAHIIKDVVNYKGELKFNSDMPDGQPRRCLDVSRAKELLHWEATTDLTAGLELTCEWYLGETR